jgi:hypothetical protein
MIINDAEGNELCMIVKKGDRPKYSNALSFFSDKEHPLQVGMWCHYNTDKQLRTHRHDSSGERIVKGFNELFYVERGRVMAYIYDNWDRPWTKVELEQGDILVQLSGGHGFEVLEDDTTVLEVKTGPYKDDKTILDLKKW